MDFIRRFLPQQKKVKNMERRLFPRHSLRLPAVLSTETGETVPVFLEDISAGGVRFRTDSSLKDDPCYILKVKTHVKNFLFGIKVEWSKKKTNGTITYGGGFVGPGSQQTEGFKNYLQSFDWQPAFRPLHLSAQ